MGQIIWNYMGIFVIPMVIGFVVRFLCRRITKAHFVTIGFLLLTAAAWVAAKVIPSRGSELYCILALMVTSAAIGSSLTGFAIRLKQKR